MGPPLSTKWSHSTHLATRPECLHGIQRWVRHSVGSKTQLSNSTRALLSCLKSINGNLATRIDWTFSRILCLFISQRTVHWVNYKLWNTFCGQESNRMSIDVVKFLPQTIVPPSQKWVEKLALGHKLDTLMSYLNTWLHYLLSISTSVVFMWLSKGSNTKPVS